MLAMYILNTLVSIHTPTQGVTKKANKGIQPSIVSIHTPTQGVTLQNMKNR